SPGQSEGATPAAFDVTPSGAASYVVPLWSPPGRGIQPSSLNFSLVYNSQSSGDILGVGWQLAGVSSRIARCSKTLGLDQEAGPVEFGPDGPFCLDGVRLVPV